MKLSIAPLRVNNPYNPTIQLHFVHVAYLIKGKERKNKQPIFASTYGRHRGDHLPLKKQLRKKKRESVFPTSNQNIRPYV